MHKCLYNHFVEQNLDVTWLSVVALISSSIAWRSGHVEDYGMEGRQAGATSEPGHTRSCPYLHFWNDTWKFSFCFCGSSERPANRLTAAATDDNSQQAASSNLYKLNIHNNDIQRIGADRSGAAWNGKRKSCANPSRRQHMDMLYAICEFEYELKYAIRL